MNCPLQIWAMRWGVPAGALDELARMMVRETMPDNINASTPESEVAKLVRLEAAGKGMVLWRNNVGQAVDQNGNYFRYGLANDSKKMNTKIKSADLVGIRPVPITQQMVGATIGQFVARETKRANWVYRDTERERAQNRFLTLVLSMGGDAAFANGKGTL